MNAKTAKTLRRFCALERLDYQRAKRSWAQLPWRDRRGVRNAMVVRIEREEQRLAAEGAAHADA